MRPSVRVLERESERETRGGAAWGGGGVGCPLVLAEQRSVRKKAATDAEQILFLVWVIKQ